MSNPRVTAEERDAALDSWWLEGKRIGIFEHIWSHWPKQAYREQSMGAFRSVFGASLESDPAFANKLWHIVQWQTREWEKEEREPRYIPSLANWIQRGQWRDAPEGV